MLHALLQLFLNLVCIAGLSFIAVGLGRILLCRTDIELVSAGECAVFSFGAGFGVLSCAVFFLGVFQGLYRPVLFGLLAVCAVLSIYGWIVSRCSGRGGKQATVSDLSPSDKWVGGLLIVCLLMGLLLVLTPAIGKDALIYHLAVPKLFLEHHGFYFIEGNVFANYPLGGEMLYVLGLALRGEVLAKGIHFVMGLAVLLGMWQFARRHIAGISFLPLALLVFLTIPTVFMMSHVAYHDLTVTLYTFLAVYAFVNWVERENKPWLIWCGVFTGLAMSTKYTALFLPFIGSLGVLWGCRRRGVSIQKAVRRLLVYLVFAGVVGCPFYVKNWVVTGNPFYPFLYGLFDGRGWSPDQARLYGLFVKSLGMGRDFVDYLLLPWNLSVNARLHSPQFDGLLGPIFLLTLPFVMGMRRVAVGAKIAMICALLLFMFWATAAQQMRYLIPIFPFLAIMVAYIVTYFRRQRVLFAFLVLVIGGSLGINGYNVLGHFLKIKPAGVVLGLESREAFLSRMIPSYDMFHYVNNNLPEESRVFLIYMKNMGYLCNRPYYSDSMFESYTIEKILSEAATPLDVYNVLKKQGFTHVLYDINYVFGSLSTFSEQQKERFLAFQKTYLKLVRSEQGRYFLACVAP